MENEIVLFVEFNLFFVSMAVWLLWTVQNVVTQE